MLWLFVIAVVTNVQDGLGACDYCSPPNGATHVMCLPPSNPGCGTSYTFSDEEKAKILEHHNTIRQRVAAGEETLTNGRLPPACEMCTLQWSDEAAIIAQRRSDSCTFEHDDLINLCDGTYCGQNLAIAGYQPEPKTPVIDIVIEHINNWYLKEASKFSPEDICSYEFDTNTGHFTQLIWADTCYMGCGLTMYEEGGFFKYFVTCNYCTGGNWGGEMVYKIPCSDAHHCDDCC